MRVFLLVPSLAPHDAIGTHTRLLCSTLEQAGIDAEIVADEQLGSVSATPFRTFRRHRLSRRSVVWYQASTTSPMAAWLEQQRARVLITYHNVTPWHYAERANVEVARALFRARAEIARLGLVTTVATAPSRFNARDLVRFGFDDVRVLAPLLELPPSRDPVPARPRASRWLFVGRLAPNKRHDRIVSALAIYRHAFDPQATVTFVGKPTEPSWFEALTTLVARLGLRDAVDIVGELDDEALHETWGTASVYVSASDHEGFGFPLIESMAAGVPVVTLARGAIAETVGDAGLLVHDAHPSSLADAVARVEHDPALRARLHERARARLAALEPSSVAQRYRALAWEAAS